MAVKVQRPFIDQIVAADLESLRYIVGWLDRHTPIGKRADLPQIMREFEYTLRLELDYVREGHHAERLALAFGGQDGIAIARIYWSHSTRRVLTMQLMNGIKVTDFPALEAAGISRPRVAELIMGAYLDQVLRIGFFHADPHPGNIFVRPGPVVVLLDYGMVGELSPQTRENIRRVFLGVIRRDFDTVLDALDRLGFIARNADRTVLKQALVWAVNTFYDMSLGELKTIDLSRVLDQVQDVLYTESVQIPANYAFLGRALGTLSGLCTALDPSFHFVSVAEPYARNLIGRPRGIVGTLQQVGDEVRALATTAYSLPYLSRDALARVQAGELSFRREIDQVGHGVQLLERSVRKILYAVLVSTLIVSGTLIFQTHYRTLSLVAFALALALLMFVFLPIQRRRP